jgi:hypothetical protein
MSTQLTSLLGKLEHQHLQQTETEVRIKDYISMLYNNVVFLSCIALMFVSDFNDHNILKTEKLLQQ